MKFLIDEKLVSALLAYLGRLPMMEVEGLVNALRAMPSVPPPPDEPGSPS